MSDEGPDNLVLRYLRAMDRKLDRVIEDLHDLKLRVGTVELGVTRIQHTLDRHSEPLDRIERRVDLLPEIAA